MDLWERKIIEYLLMISSLILASLKFRSSSDREEDPRIDSAMIALARDLELPGLPTRNSGIFSSIQTAIIKMFSLRAAFFAMLRPSSMLSSSTSWQLYTIASH